jgi:hypothetical protein
MSCGGWRASARVIRRTTAGHGLGFAGALKEIGLRQNYPSVALLTFNVGGELGQLMVVAIA